MSNLNRMPRPSLDKLQKNYRDTLEREREVLTAPTLLQIELKLEEIQKEIDRRSEIGRVRQYVGHWVDDALSTHQQPSTLRTRYVGWQCGCEPMYVAVNSYLPDSEVDDDEAVMLATWVLVEKKWFSGEPTTPDFIL